MRFHVWGGRCGHGIVVMIRMDSRRLVQHRCDNLLYAFGTQPKVSCKGHILPTLPRFFLTATEVAERAEPSLQNRNLFTITGQFFIFFKVLWTPCVSIVLGRGTTGAVSHAQFGPSLSEASAAMYPEHIVNNKSTS
jgi:hypothetical protein